MELLDRYKEGNKIGNLNKAIYGTRYLNGITDLALTYRPSESSFQEML